MRGAESTVILSEAMGTEECGASVHSRGSEVQESYLYVVKVTRQADTGRFTDPLSHPSTGGLTNYKQPPKDSPWPRHTLGPGHTMKTQVSPQL